LLDRDVGRPFAFEDLVHKGRGVTPKFIKIDTVSDKAPGPSELGKAASR